MSSSDIETSFLNTRELSRNDAYWRRLAVEDEPASQQQQQQSSKRYSKQQRNKNTALDELEQMMEESSASDSDSDASSCSRQQPCCGRSTESPAPNGFLHYSPSKAHALNDSDGFELPPPIDTSLPSSALRSAAIAPPGSEPRHQKPVAGPSRHAHKEADSDSSDDLVILPASASKPTSTKSSNSATNQKRHRSTSHQTRKDQGQDKRASLLALGRNSHERQGSSTSPQHQRKSQHQRLIEELNFSDPEEPQPHEHDVLQQLQQHHQPIYVGSDQENQDDDDVEEEEEDVPLRLLAGKSKRKGAGWFNAPASASTSRLQTAQWSRQAGSSSSKSRRKGSQDSNQPTLDLFSQPGPKEVDVKGKKKAQPEPLFIGDDDREEVGDGHDDDSIQDGDEEEEDAEGETNDILQGPGMLAGLSEDKRAMMLSIALGSSSSSRKRKKTEKAEDPEWGFFVQEPAPRQPYSGKGGKKGTRGSWRGRRGGRGRRGSSRRGK